MTPQAYLSEILNESKFAIIQAESVSNSVARLRLQAIGNALLLPQQRSVVQEPSIFPLQNQPGPHRLLLRQMAADIQHPFQEV